MLPTDFLNIPNTYLKKYLQNKINVDKSRSYYLIMNFNLYLVYLKSNE